MDATLESNVAWAARRFREADTAVVLADARMSVALDILGFRGDDDIWEIEFDPASFHRDRSANDPAGFWHDRIHLQERMLPDGIEPNPGCEALLVLELRGVLDAAVTQNTDDFHREADFGRVVELRGSAVEVVCEDCGARTDAAPVFGTVRAGDTLPMCDDCDGLFKPGVVLFGRRLPRVTYSGANRLAGDTDVFLLPGSSLTVYPVTSLAGRAAEVGSFIVVDFDAMQYDDRVDRVVRGDLVVFLPEVEK